jgi:hypothetical protein
MIGRDHEAHVDPCLWGNNHGLRAWWVVDAIAENVILIRDPTVDAVSSGRWNARNDGFRLISPQSCTTRGKITSATRAGGNTQLTELSRAGLFKRLGRVQEVAFDRDHMVQENRPQFG